MTGSTRRSRVGHPSNAGNRTPIEPTPVEPTPGGSAPTIDDVRAIAGQLPRSYEALVRDRVKFRVGRIVWLAFSHDETIMGFAFPKEERDALVAAEPRKFLLPRASDLRYNWVNARLDALTHDELGEIVEEAWRMVVPKRVADQYFVGASTRLDNVTSLQQTTPLDAIDPTPRSPTLPGPMTELSQ